TFFRTSARGTLRTRRVTSSWRMRQVIRPNHRPPAVSASVIPHKRYFVFMDADFFCFEFRAYSAPFGLHARKECDKGKSIQGRNRQEKGQKGGAASREYLASYEPQQLGFRVEVGSKSPRAAPATRSSCKSCPGAFHSSRGPNIGRGQGAAPR